MKNRWFALDYFKFLAIFFMILPHSLVWWVTSNDKIIETQYVQFWPMIKNVIHCMSIFPLMYPVATGLNLGFQYHKFSDNSFFPKSLKIFIVGFLMNLITWGFDDFFTWDVLPFTGLFFLLMGLFKIKNPNKNLIAITAICILLITNLIRSLPFPNDNIITFIISGDIHGNNYFPFFPWASYILIGFLIGLHNNNFYTIKKINNIHYILFGVIVVFVIFYLMKIPYFKLNPNNIWGPVVFMPDPYLAIGVLGGFFILFGLLNFLPKIESTSNIVFQWSEQLLTIYVLHTFIFYHFTMILKKHLTFSWAHFILYCIFQVLIMGLIVYIFQKKRWKLT